MSRKLCFAVLLLAALLASSISPLSVRAQTLAQSSAPESALSVQAPDLTLGSPGFVLRTANRFGEVTSAYLEDHTHLNYPYGLSTSGNSVWIADTSGSRAVHYSSAGTYLGQIGKAGFRNAYSQTNLDMVMDVQADAAGNVYLVDRNASHVAVFRPDGTYLRDIGRQWASGQGNDSLNSPYGIAFDAANRAYVADSGNCRIQVFLSDGSYLATLGETGVCGVENNHFGSALRHMDVYGSQLYAADASNHRVQIFDISNPAGGMPLLATIGVSGELGSGNDHLNWPTGVAVDASLVYVADMHNQRVQIFNRSTRAYVKTLTGLSAGDAFLWPSDVAVDGSGNLYVADQGNARVVQYNASQVYTRTYGVKGVPYVTDALHYNRPSGVAAGPQGNIYVVEQWGCRLVTLNSKGVPLSTFGEPGVCGSDTAHLSTPEGVTVNPYNGEVFVADADNDRLMVFSAAGAYLRSLGSSGSGNLQFSHPVGAAFGSNGRLYVADKFNNRVQVFGTGFTYVGTIPGFTEVVDVAAGPNGRVYVLDRGAKSVEIYDQNLQHVQTMGGIDGSSLVTFGALNDPTALAVDSAGRIYVAPTWGHHILVFDAGGTFIGAYGSWGDGMGQMRQIEGLAFTPQGTLLAAGNLNHVVDSLVQGVPHFMAANLPGFGDPRVHQIPAMAVYNNQLFAGASYVDSGGQHADLYHSATGRSWTNVNVDFGIGVSSLVGFNGKLYLGTWNNKIWRSADGKTNWNVVVEDAFGSGNTGISHLAVYNGYLYAATWTDGSGTRVWRSATGNSGSWTQVNADGFGDADLRGVTSSAVFNGQLYLGVSDFTTNAPVLARTSSGTSWDLVGRAAFQAAGEQCISALEVFQGRLYALITGGGSTKIWSSSDGAAWQAASAFSVPESGEIGGLRVFNGSLYAVVGNVQKGAQVWRTRDGAAWEMLSAHGLNGPENERAYFNQSTVVFKDQLFFALENYTNGATLWSLARETYIPAVKR